MDWNSISFEVDTKSKPIALDEEKVFDGTEYTTGEDGYLHRVSRDAIKGPTIRKGKVRSGSLKAYAIIRHHFKVGEIVSFDKIREVIGRGQRSAGTSCMYLWLNGWLDKWAAGEFFGGKTGKFAGQVGKFYGVHYQILPKGEEEFEKRKHEILHD